MLSKASQPYRRQQVSVLSSRLAEQRRFIHVVTGPRQVGKTTLVLQALAGQGLPTIYASADEPGLRDAAWLRQNWEAARLQSGTGKAILVLDEIQKITDWSETVKYLWDADTREEIQLQVVILGSAPILIGRGLTESLAGRFETLHAPHWSWPEMRDAFGLTLDEYVFFGGYPGSIPLKDDWSRWRRYVLDSLIETALSRDILLLTRIDKPALLRRLFMLACEYSGRELSYTKMLGQLQDAGNTTTLAHYLDLLTGAGMVTGLQKFAGETVRRRASSPKLQVFNTALMTAVIGRNLEEAKADRQYWGRLVESAVGAHLVNAAAGGSIDVHYWRSGNYEVDFVLARGKTVTALEVKSGRSTAAHSGMTRFTEEFGPARTLLVGNEGLGLEQFLNLDLGDL